MSKEFKVKQYDKYSDVPKKYRYDLEFLLEGKTKEELKNQIVKLLKESIKNKDSKYDSSASFLESLKHSDKFEQLTNRLFNYISNSLAVNVVDADMKKFAEELEFEMYNLNKELGAEQARFFKNAKKVKEWIKLKEFQPYKKDLQSLLDDKKHQLSKEIQEFRQLESRADIPVDEIFSIITNSELDFGFATTTSGKKIKVTEANRSVLAKHKDKNVRKTAAISYRDGFLKHKQSLSNMLYQQFKRTSVWANLTKHKSSIEYLLYSDRVPEKMLLSLYKSVEDNNKVFKKYDTYWKKFYRARFKETPTKYDRSRDLVTAKTSYSPEEAIDIVKEAIKPFGKEYVDVANKAFTENWIDFMPVKNKRSGAYSIGGTYGVSKKLINMNFDGTFRSVSTLSHELGHSMHSYFSDKNQPQSLSQYPIFVAEIASIFNELILNDYLLNNTNDEKLRFNIMDKMIVDFRGTVIRQVNWSNFEYEMYKAIDEGKPVSTYEQISEIYNKVSLKYKVDKRPNKPEDAWMGIMVPHFYAHFYVYKYAIGQLCANIFFQKYKEEGPIALQFYINEFLSAGDSDWPLNVLKNAGIDLNDVETYKIGFRSIENTIDEWIRTGKKIFKL